MNLNNVNLVPNRYLLGLNRCTETLMLPVLSVLTRIRKRIPASRLLSGFRSLLSLIAQQISGMAHSARRCYLLGWRRPPRHTEILQCFRTQARKAQNVLNEATQNFSPKTKATVLPGWNRLELFRVVCEHTGIALGCCADT